VAGYSRWAADLPAHLRWLWYHAAAVWWPWLPLAVLLIGAIAIASRLAWRTAWRRAVAGGYWLAVTPPRSIDPGRLAKLWPTLYPLAPVAAGGGGRWRLVRPPLAFEVYHDGDGTLRAGLWLPGWVAADKAASAVGQAWPGAVVTCTAPPALDPGGGTVAGVRLTPDGWHPDTGWLVNDIRPRTGSRRGWSGGAGGDDPDLAGVFASLGQPDGPVLWQVLVRPATRRRLAHLGMAGRRPTTPRRRGGATVGVLLWVLNLVRSLVLGLFDIFIPGPPASPRSARPEPPDAIQREAMAEARSKKATGPLMLATIRVGAASGLRRDARQAAEAVANGYAETSRALQPVRLTRPAVLLAERRAHRGDWYLVTAAELGILAHLPPDPTLYGFDTAALHRSAPTGTPRARPERSGPTWAGWNRDQRTRPPATTAADHDTDPPHDCPEQAPQQPAPRTTPYYATDDEEDDEGGDDWDDEDPY
jgi:hypothetical protein